MQLKKCVNKMIVSKYLPLELEVDVIKTWSKDALMLEMDSIVLLKTESQKS